MKGKPRWFYYLEKHVMQPWYVWILWNQGQNFSLFFLLMFEVAGRQSSQKMDKVHLSDLNIPIPFSANTNN